MLESTTRPTSCLGQEHCTLLSVIEQFRLILSLSFQPKVLLSDELTLLRIAVDVHSTHFIILFLAEHISATHRTCFP